MARLKGSNQMKVRQHNSTNIKEAIYKYGPLPRLRIAHMLGLSLPTVTTKVSDMIAAGIVREQSVEEEQAEIALGRRAVNVDFVPEAAFFIGVEVAPGRRAICLTNVRANVIYEKLYESDITDYTDTVNDLVEKISICIRETGLDKNRIRGIGVGSVGFVDSRKGIIRRFHRFGWEQCPMANDLAEKTGFPVKLDNNVRARAVGEDLTNNQPRPDNFVYLYVFQGIGCPLYVRSSLFSGSTYSAGELGHMVMDINGLKCESCGNRGCLEAYASEPAILRRCRSAMEGGVETMITTLVKKPDELTMEEVLLAYRCGDPVVCAIIHTAVCYLAVAMANVVNLINPWLLIVDAYVMQEEKIREDFTEILRQNLYGINDSEITVEFKEYDRLRGAKGAAALAIQHFFIEERQ